MNTPKTNPSGAAQAANVSLNVRTLEMNPTNLLFQYEVCNQTQAPIYIFSLLYNTEPSGEVHLDENLVYSFLQNDDTIEMTKSMLEVPPWAVVEAPEEPFLFRVDEGTKYKETISVSIPVRCHDPYDDNYPAGYQASVVPVKGWRFSVGVVTDDPQHHVIKKATVNGRDVFRVGYSDGIVRQKVLRSELLLSPLTVFKPKCAREQQFLRQSEI